MTPLPYPPVPYTRTYTSAHTRARIVKILLIVGAVTTALSLLADALSLAFPPLGEEQEFADNPAAATVMLFGFLFGVIDLIIYLTTVVFFLMWLYRAYGNVPALAPSSRPDYSPTWAAGSFFIPFVNLVVPYRAVKEVWQKSGPPDEGILSAPSPPAWFPVWWAFWLLASFAGNISMRASFNENVTQSTATMISIVASALSIIAAVLAYLVVDAIDKRQEETSAKVNVATFQGPPPPPTSYPPMSDVVAPTP